MTDIPSRDGELQRASPVVIFTGTIFLSAALLFFVQPLFARIVLPVLGGAPAVWTTAMLFFQTVLIGGYLYAHLMIRHVPVRLQVAIHLVLWALALFFLPLAIPEGWQPDPGGNTALQTLGVFAIGVGAPFAVLSANAPLLQAWYARSGGPSAEDPYFLYAASNLGSLLALLAFPLIAEPLFGAAAIGYGFAGGFAVLGAGLLATGVMARGDIVAQKIETAVDRIPTKRIGYWLLLAFVPSSMMLAVTTQIATDVGAIPLVWVVPLALYLLSFVVVFRNTMMLPLAALKLLAVAGVGWAGWVFAGQTGSSLKIVEGAGLALAFFAIALFAHRRLYEARPDGGHLTLFYLVMSVGGALGGLFNSILAPALFDTLIEGGATTLIAAALLLSRQAIPTLRGGTLALLYGLFGSAVLWLATTQFGISGMAFQVAMFALAGLAIVVFRGQVGQVAIAALLIVTLGKSTLPSPHIFMDRSFFGVHRVSDRGDFRLYVNGNTVHGKQRLSEIGQPHPTPLAYYHANGPLAQIMTEGPGANADSVGIVGLGVGAMACYARPGQTWSYYEIDPVVDRVARDTSLFTFVSTCTPDAPTYLGDARRVLADQTDTAYDVLLVDAYSSDAVPVHLTTLEAMQLYLDRLTADGVAVFHISNRYFAIEKPLARAAAELGLVARMRVYRSDQTDGDLNTDAVIIAREEEHLGAIANDPDWLPLYSDGGALWTDDFANPLSIIRW